MIEQNCFAESVVVHLPFLNRFVCRVMNGDAMADDVVQQTVLKALLNAAQFRGESGLKSWLASIAINEVRAVYRSKWVRSTVPLVTETVDRHRCHVPYDAFEEKQRRDLLRDAVSRLPDGYRRVVELCEFRDVRSSEAGLRLGLSAVAVKIRRHRARQKLKLLVAKPKLRYHASDGPRSS